MSKGDSEHVAQHVHGVVPRPEPAAPQTIEQRVAKLEATVAKLEAAQQAARDANKVPVARRS